jgi:hypothetical protein
MPELKPFNSSWVKIPALLKIDFDGNIDEIPYPANGTIAEKLEYINLMNALQIGNICDESIIK